MTERVQGSQPGWKQHVPGGNGALCCAPQYLSQQMFQAFAFPFGTGNNPIDIDLDASVCGQDEPLTAVIRPSFINLAATPPLVTSVVYDGLANSLRVVIDASNSEVGLFVLEITNACGCCFLLPLEGTQE